MKLAANGGERSKSKPFPRWPQHTAREAELLMDVLESGDWGTLSPKSLEFGEKFAAYLGVKHAQTVSNGTVSLEILLRALGVEAGDEIIVPSYTFVATATSVLMAGGVPVFADIDPETNLMDPDSVASLITSRTKAVIPVHMAGFPADMDRLLKICRRNDLYLIEDAAQAHGTQYRGKKVGSLGTAGSFSFQNSKNMSSGEGGAIVCDDDELWETVWSIHHVGRKRGDAFYQHHRICSNYRISDFQAAILLAQLERLDGQIDRRESGFDTLNRDMAGIRGIELFHRPEWADRISHHLYMFRYDETAYPGLSRKKLIELLQAEGLPAVDGYTPLYKQPLFQNKAMLPEACAAQNYETLFLPGTEKACSQTVWLTQNILLGDEQDLAETVGAVKKVLQYYGEKT